MSIFENASFDNHESVHAFFDPKTKLRAFIAVHSTYLGPSAGGCRLWSYDVSDDALTDVLRLSRGMSYKNAMAGLNLGGGKAVVMRPEGPEGKEDGNFDRDALFTSFGRALDNLNGHYYTAEDVGMSPDDMRVIRAQTKYVAGLDEGEAASGDPSPVTADGVFRSIVLAVRKKMGCGVEGLSVAVQGLGHVGYDVCARLHGAGANLIVTDINQYVLKKAREQFGAKVVDLDAIYDADVDIFSPCALGAILNQETLPRINAKIIAGAANNQLSVPAIGQKLQEKGILYCPDYVVNAGGIINIAGEIEGNYSKAWVEEKLSGVQKTLEDILDLSARTGRTADVIADEMAQARIGR
ncbi:MAG: Glu/Leu/Phe/Val dehydrogenase dimerization domain-containing protein [Robiginitomaculum sp.]